jgi:Endonuclease-reverse transcriptase
MFTREGIIVNEIEHYDLECEALFSSLTMESLGELIVGVCYRSPNADKEEVENLFATIRNHADELMVLMGDFNYGDIDWNFMDATADVEIFLELAQYCFLTQKMSVCVAEWIRSPPLTREGSGSIPGTGKLDSGFHPFGVGKMSSS